MGETTVLRHQPVGVARANLDMIAEHRIMADFQRRHPCRLAISGFERGNRSPPLAARGPKRVERRVVALGDIATLERIDRRLFN